MKFRAKNFTIEHYLRYVRRQSKHVQHLHAIAFAGIITMVIAGFILYADYGFWHETYHRPDDQENVQASTTDFSFGDFLEQAKDKFNAIGSSSANLLEGKETYRKESQ